MVLLKARSWGLEVWRIGGGQFGAAVGLEGVAFLALSVAQRRMLRKHGVCRYQWGG